MKLATGGYVVRPPRPSTVYVTAITAYLVISWSWL